MNDFFHNYWQIAFVLTCSVLLGLQIPRRAIFFTPASTDNVVAPYASFVTYDSAAYAELMRRVQVSWRLRSSTARADLAGADIDAVVLSEPEPEPSYLPLPDLVSKEPFPPLPASWEGALTSLLPPSLAAPAPTALPPLPDLPPGAVRPESLRRAELLALPDSLKD